MITYDAVTQVMEHTNLTHVISFHGTPLPGDVWGWGIRPHYLIHYVTHGQGLLEIGGSSYPLSAGQAFLIRPYHLVRYSSCADNPITYWWVEWRGEGSDQLVDAMGFDQDHPVLTFRSSTEVLAAMDLLERAQDGSLADNLERKGELYRLMSCFLRNSMRADHADVKDSRAYFITAEHYIRSRLSDPELSVSSTAGDVCISRKYLHSLFTQYAGKSVSDFIIDERMTMAKELLKQNLLTVSSVAISVGYNDPFAFTRIFKKRVGIPPSQYAREYRPYD